MSTPDQGCRPKILVIDDDPVVLATTEALLEASGYDVITQMGPFGTSAAIVKNRPDLVLLDLNMPALSGPDLAEMIQEKPWAATTRIYFYSSSDDEVLRAAAEEARVDGYIRKGDRTELSEKVRRALGR